MMRKSEENLYYYIPFWNQDETEFKKLIGDRSRHALEEITNINDLNVGSIHNAIYWHLYWQNRCVYESELKNSSGMLLKYWAKFYGISKPYPMGDEEFIGYIIQKILAGVVSFATIELIFTGFEVRKNPDTPCHADVCFADAGVISPLNPYFMYSSTVCHTASVTYIYMDDLSEFTDIMRGKLTGVSAGTGVYIGVY
jgi:hypothetical protein